MKGKRTKAFLVESVLLGILLLLIASIMYYQFVYKRAIEREMELEEQRETLLAQLETLDATLNDLKRMDRELQALDENTSLVASYNNAKEELARLNRALQMATTYTVSFANVTRQGDLIRRNFSLSFTADSFETVKYIISELNKCDLRCLIGDIQYSSNRAGGANVSMTATFFETMVGGTPDAGLPSAK